MGDIQNKTIITIAGGINNLTRKIRHRDGTEIWYDMESPTQKPENVIQEIHSIHQNLSQNFNSTIKFATIPPASIAKFQDFNRTKFRLSHSIFTPGFIQEQQRQLENSIQLINNSITSLNTTNRVRAITWDKDVTKITIKKRGRHGQNKKKITKFIYKELYDGVHAEKKLANTWFKVMTNSIVQDLKCPLSLSQEVDANSELGNTFIKPTCTQDTVDDRSQEESECEVESWDFKRSRLSL